MVTHWRTDPIMDNPSSRQRRGPQIYVHVEFGVSWSARAPKNHEITFRSRGVRERSPAFPRQVPARNTNYLAAIHDFQQRQEGQRRHHERRQQQYHQQQQQQHQITWGQNETTIERGRGIHQEDNQVMLRPTRVESRSSHERGHSAPPPFGSNPWDVNVVQSQNPSHYQDVSIGSSQGPPQVWKALPAVPSQFRLGEDGMPWSSHAWPGGEPDAYPLDEDSLSGSDSRRPQTGQTPIDISPSALPMFSPAGPQDRIQDQDRVRDLEALSAAMMTVDNGFENQWWNQGGRELTATLGTSTQETPAAGRFSFGSLGWAVANTPATPARPNRGSLAAANIISPVSDYVDSPPPFYNSLQRSMSTRSEELFFTERTPNSAMAA